MAEIDKLFALLVENEDAFCREPNLREHCNKKKDNKSLLEIAIEKEKWRAGRKLIENGADLEDPDFTIKALSKCGLFREMEEIDCNNLDLLKELCVFVFKSFKEEKNDSVNYRMCFKKLIDKILSINHEFIVPEFEDCPGIYLYIANIDLELSKNYQNYLDDLVREHEDLEKLTACCDGYITEDNDTITFHYKNFLPIDNPMKILKYLADNYKLKRILSHCLFKALLSSTKIFGYDRSFWVVSSLVGIFFLMMLTVPPAFAIFMLIPFFLIGLFLCKYVEVDANTLIVYILVPTISIALNLLHGNTLPLVIPLISLWIFLELPGNDIYKQILIRAIGRKLPFFFETAVLLIGVTCSMYLFFNKDQYVYSSFKSPCQQYYCQNPTNLNISTSACQKALHSKNIETCDEYQNNATQFIQDLWYPCIQYPNIVTSEKVEECDYFFEEIAQKGYTIKGHCGKSSTCQKVNNKITVTRFQEECKRSIDSFDFENRINEICESVSLQGAFEKFRNFCDPLFCSQETGNSGDFLLTALNTVKICAGMADLPSLDSTSNPYGPLIRAILLLTFQIFLTQIFTAFASDDIKIVKCEIELSRIVDAINRGNIDPVEKLVLKKKTRLFIKKNQEWVVENIKSLFNEEKNFSECGGFSLMGIHISEDTYEEVLEKLSENHSKKS